MNVNSTLVAQHKSHPDYNYYERALLRTEQVEHMNYQ